MWLAGSGSSRLLGDHEVPLSETAGTESPAICDVNAARGFPRSEGARLWLYRHEPEDVRLATIVEVRLRHDYLVTDDPEGVKHLQHLIAADKIGCAFHHHDSTALHGVDDFLDRY